MKHFVVGPKGGSVSFVDQTTGEAREIALSPGVYPLARFAPMRGPNERICVPGPRLDGQHFFTSSGNTETCKPLGQFESAANPHFRVSPAARQVREMQRMMQRTEALAKRTAKMQRAMARAKAAPAPAQIAPPVDDAGQVSAT